MCLYIVRQSDSESKCGILARKLSDPPAKDWSGKVEREFFCYDASLSKDKNSFSLLTVRGHHKYKQVSAYKTVFMRWNLNSIFFKLLVHNLWQKWQDCYTREERSWIRRGLYLLHVPGNWWQRSSLGRAQEQTRAVAGRLGDKGCIYTKGIGDASALYCLQGEPYKYQRGRLQMQVSREITKFWKKNALFALINILLQFFAAGHFVFGF